MAEKNLVRLSLFLVLVAFAFTYLIFADKNPDLWQKQDEVLMADKSWEEVIVVKNSDANTLDNPNYTEQDLLAKLKWIDDQSQSKSLLILSGTTLTYNELDSLNKLGLTPKYILKWKNDIYFVNLWKGEIELSFRVSKYLWTIKTITDLAEIKKNGFNLLIMKYVNIPTRKDTLTIFLTKQNTDNRLVQASKESYYNNKKYISDTLNSAY
jgi:hypothetical protein